MPRCNLTLKQKVQIIDLSGELSTEQIAKKFHVHPTTVTRTLQKKQRILDQASRINVNFKTVQTNKRGEEHDSMILEFIKTKQDANEPITIKDICDKALECAQSLDRSIKSKRGWWRRFKVRCNIVKSRMQRTIGPSHELAQQREPVKRKPDKKSQVSFKKNYTFKIKETGAQGNNQPQRNSLP